MRDLFHLPDQNPLTVGGLAKFCNASAEGALNISCVWNNPQINFNGLYMRVNNINSGSSSDLLNIGTSTTVYLRLDMAGNLRCPGGLEMGTINGAINQTRISPHGTGVLFNAGGSFTTKITPSELRLPANQALIWTDTSNNAYSASTSVGLIRGGNNILSQRNGINPQEFQIYNTYNGTNDEWGYLKWDSNVLKLGATKSGTGVMRNLMLESTNRSAYIATPTVEQIRDILISFGLMAAP